MRFKQSLTVAAFLAAWAATAAIGQQTEEVAVGDDPIEYWYGILDAGNRKFRFVLELEHTAAAWTGNLLSIDEGRSRFKLDALQRTDNELSFEIRASAGAYAGKLSDDGQVIRGRWKQREADLELVFQKVESVPKEQYKALWVGELKVVLQTLKVAFRELEDGSVLFDSLTQKASGFVASKEENDNDVVFDVPAVRGKFSGKYNADKTEIVGKWTQGFIPLALTLRKSQESEVQLGLREQPRPQMPKPPFPYEVSEVMITNPKASGVKLAGSLTLPAGTARVPAVVLISGSGPQDRDESIAGHKPFWVLADHLSRNGIAVLRFDDRGFGKSQGDFAAAATPDFASDVEAIISFLISHERIDPQRVGLCGHSEGGLIAPLVASQDQRVAFIILMAGPGVNGDRILTSQLRLILQASGVPSDEIERQAKIQRVFLDLAQQTPQLSREDFLAAAHARMETMMSAEEHAAETTQQQIAVAAAQLLNPWFRFFISHEPASVLSQVTCPVLAVNGSQDLQVEATLNIPAIQAAFAGHGRQQLLETQIFPGLNHLFQECKTGNIDEYELIEETIHPSVLDRITTWILAQD